MKTIAKIQKREAEIKAELKSLKAAAKAATEADENAKLAAIAAQIRKCGLHKFDPASLEAGLQKLAAEMEATASQKT